MLDAAARHRVQVSSEECVTVVNIVELAPVFADAGNPEFVIVNGIWNSREATSDHARDHGHTYWRPADGGLAQDELSSALATADVVVLAPTNATATGMRALSPGHVAPGDAKPSDGAEAGRVIGHRVLDQLSSTWPDIHVVYISHFLVGHGQSHHNAKPHTWGLRALEAHLRGGRNPWTILRPTWLSTIHDESYRTRLSQDQHADGLVSTASIAATVVSAIEHPQASTGRTASIYNLSIPDAGSTDLAAQFAALEPDYEATLSRQTVPA